MATCLCLQDDNRGGYLIVADQTSFLVADQTSFPAATTMCGALVKFAPGGLRQMHWHTTLDEWQFVINGTFEVQPSLCVTMPCDLADSTSMLGFVCRHGCALHCLLG